MKRFFSCILVFFLLFSFSYEAGAASGKAGKADRAPEPDPAADSDGGTRVDIPKLNGSVCIPDGYYAFGEDIPFTDQMCIDVGSTPENMQAALPFLQGQALLIPVVGANGDSIQIHIKVKDKRYGNITLSKLSLSDFQDFAAAVVSSFGVTDYDMVEGNDLRFFVFDADQGLGNVCRYATVLNGHMVYIYANTGSSPASEEQRAVLEYIALSIRHGL